MIDRQLLVSAEIANAPGTKFGARGLEMLKILEADDELQAMPPIELCGVMAHKLIESAVLAIIAARSLERDAGPGTIEPVPMCLVEIVGAAAAAYGSLGKALSAYPRGREA